MRKRKAKVTVVVLGAGPIGVTAALIAVRSGRVSSLTLYESDEKNKALKRNYQISLDRRSVSFLRRIGVDFDNLEGCWDNRCFYTTIGVYLEYILCAIKSYHIDVDVKFDTQVSLFFSQMLFA